MIRVIVADDEPLFQRLIGSVIALMAKEEMEFAGACDSASKAIALARDQRADVLILDVRLPPKPGARAIAQDPGIMARLQSEAPDCAVVCFSGMSQWGDVSALITAGALGVVRKGCMPEAIMEAVRAAHRGELYFGPDLLAESGFVNAMPAALRERIAGQSA